MQTTQRPSTTEMYRALLERDRAYEGVFFVAVRTTGVFCRPTCPARKPERRNVEFYSTTKEALSSGFRPCKRCRPMELLGEAPEWLRPLLDAVEEDPASRWTDADLRERGLDPARVRRWFHERHGMTFHAYLRARRLGTALGQIRHGADLTETAYDAGYESPSAFRDAFGRYFGKTPGKSRDAVPVVMTRIASPLGPLVVAASDSGILLLEFADRRMLETQIRRVGALVGGRAAPGSNAHVAALEEELKRYFEGSLKTFTVPIVEPGTPFQESVWTRLRRIPYGETISYDRLARDIGRPGAQRAVGKANGDNRIAILVPCHRVVRANGELSGYGGGVWRKQALLDLERAHRS